ncbi:MAG: transposase [Acidobacteriia bacterium]|nr:transposase [Terriglobia bacterium]
MVGDEETARALLESIRWPAGPVCAHCGGTEKIYRLRRRPGSGIRTGLWKCGHCRKQFTVTGNTIFEGTHLALHKWLGAIRLVCTLQDGATARQLADSLGITTKTARGILKKIHDAVTHALPVARPQDSILRQMAYKRKGSLYPISLNAAVDVLLKVQPARKHPDALERRVAEMEAARRRGA